MEEILHQFIGSSPHYSQGFIHLRWCRIAAINGRIIQWSETKTNTKYQWETQSGQTFIHPTTCLQEKMPLPWGIRFVHQAPIPRLRKDLLGNSCQHRRLQVFNQSLHESTSMSSNKKMTLSAPKNTTGWWLNQPTWKIMRPSNWKSSYQIQVKIKNIEETSTKTRDPYSPKISGT